MRRWGLVVLWSMQLELRRWIRQPLAVATALVLPVAVACVVTAAVGGDLDYSTTWAVVDEDVGPIGDGFFNNALDDHALRDVVTVRRVDEAEARRLLDDGEVSAIVILSKNLSEDIRPDRGARPEVIVPDDPWVGADMAEVVVDAFAAEVWTEAVRRDGELGVEAPRLRVRVEQAGGARLDAATHFGPAIAMFFLLLALGFGAQSEVGDRQNGTLDRLRVARVPAGAVSLGRGLFGMLLGGLSLTISGLVLGLVFDRSWGPPGPVALLVLAVVVCFTGMATLVARLTRTAGAVAMLTTGIAFVMAVGSGSFASPGATDRPGFGDLVPVGQALDGFASLVTGEGLASITDELVYLTVVGLVLLAVAAMLGRRAA